VSGFPGGAIPPHFCIFQATGDESEGWRSAPGCSGEALAGADHGLRAAAFGLGDIHYWLA